MIVLNYFVSAVVHPFCLAFLWSKVLNKRWDKMNDWVVAVIYTLLEQIPSLIRTFSTDMDCIDIMGIIQTVITIFMVLIFFDDRMWKKGVSFIVYMYFLRLGEVIGVLVISANDVTGNMISKTDGSVLFKCGIVFLTICLYLLVTYIWLLRNREKAMARNNWLILVLPLIQLAAYEFFGEYSRSYSFPFFPGSLENINPMAGFVIDVYMFYIIISQSEKNELERQVDELEHLRKIEQSRYDSLEIQQENIAKIRHDYNNQLLVALRIAEEGHCEQAGELLKEMQNNLEEVNAHTWCRNPIICAVLSEKEVRCREEGITLKAAVDVDELPKIQPVHLCSLFSNLIDNAISGVSKCEERYRQISVKAVKKGVYLHVKVENYAQDPAKDKKRPGHGYGQEILRDIAKNYNGDFQCRWEHGVYTATISIEVSEKSSDFD